VPSVAIGAVQSALQAVRRYDLTLINGALPFNNTLRQ
jgi:hypothetical protein